ncbi:TPA: hypothetical protein ACQUJM_000121 [Neisseria polysaccharea]
MLSSVNWSDGQNQRRKLGKKELEVRLEKLQQQLGDRQTDALNVLAVELIIARWLAKRLRTGSAIMNSYFLDTSAPLVFRSSKPFGAQSDIDDIQFSLPSAAAGLVRAQVMLCAKTVGIGRMKPGATVPDCRTNRQQDCA